MTPDSAAAVDAYWAADFGCDAGSLRPAEPRVQVHAGGVTGYSGVFILVAGAAPVISAPPPLAYQLMSRAPAFTADAVSDPRKLRDLLQGAPVTDVIGPALLKYADGTSFTPVERGSVRRLTLADAEAFQSLRAACPPDEWDPKTFDLATRPTFGSFGESGQLLAIADYEIWGERIAHFGLITHPAARGQGHGARVMAVAARAALETGLVLQYRALAHNHPSVAIARKLGFRDYGWTIAARLAAPE